MIPSPPRSSLYHAMHIYYIAKYTNIRITTYALHNVGLGNAIVKTGM